MSQLAKTVQKLAEPLVVIRKAAPTFDDVSPYATGGAEVRAIVRVHLQKDTARPTQLLRTMTGDETTGESRLWVANEDLAAAYAEGDINQTPLGWTTFQIAPPEDTDGPPGDRFNWDGRNWEITEFQGWERKFGGFADFQRYTVQERGAEL